MGLGRSLRSALGVGKANVLGLWIHLLFPFPLRVLPIPIKLGFVLVLWLGLLFSTLESTSLTSDDTIVHFPPFPRSTRRNKSKVNEYVLIFPLILDVSSAPICVFAFSEYKSHWSWWKELEAEVFKFRNSAIFSFPLIQPPWLLCSAATTIGFDYLCGWPCPAREAGSNVFLRCRSKPLHPLPILPSVITMLPLCQPCKSSESNRKMPWALEPIYGIRTFSPSLLVLAKWSEDCLERNSSMWNNNLRALSLPIKTKNSDPSQQSVAGKRPPFLNWKLKSFGFNE